MFSSHAFRYLYCELSDSRPCVPQAAAAIWTSLRICIKKYGFSPRKTGIPGGNAGISSDIPARMFFSIIAIRVLPPSNWPVLLSRGFQHMLQQDAVALGGVIHQHVGHSPHKAPVLDDGAAAHDCVKIGTTIFLNFFRLPFFQGEFQGILSIRKAHPRSSTQCGSFYPDEQRFF